MWEMSGFCFSGEDLTAIGVLSLLTGVVTELTKNIRFLQRIPTDLQALVLGVVFSLAAAFLPREGAGVWPGWAGLFQGGVRGVLAAFVATYGWTKLDTLVQRFVQNGGEDHDGSGTAGSRSS